MLESKEDKMNQNSREDWIVDMYVGDRQTIFLEELAHSDGDFEP